MAKILLLCALLVQGIFAVQEPDHPTWLTGSNTDDEALPSAPSGQVDSGEQSFYPEYEHIFDTEKDHNETEKVEEIADPPVEETSVTTNLPELENSGDLLNSKAAAVESCIDKFVTSTGLSPEEQIEKIQEASKRMAKCIEREFASLEAMISSGKRNKRDVSSLTGNKYLMRLLKHIRANNEHQNVAIDKMMSGQEIAEKYGIDFTPDFEMNQVSYEPLDLGVDASEPVPEISNEIPKETDVENIEEKKTTETAQDITTEQPETTYPQQYSYENTPNPDTPTVYQTPDGAYYYYQIDTPLETDSQSTSQDPIKEPVQFQANTEQPKQSDQPQAYSGYGAQQTAFQGTSQRFNPFYVPQVSSTPYVAYTGLNAAEQPAYFVMTPYEEQGSEVFEEQFEEKVESEAVAEHGDEPKVKNINRSSSYRRSRASPYAHHHHYQRIAEMPQQFQYYFTLA